MTQGDAQARENRDGAVSRRGFVAAGTAAAAALAATGQVARASEGTQDPERPWIPAWDEECDVVVAGYGAAGVSTAITACKQGMKTIVLEKSPQEDGGNFGCSTSNMHDTFRCDIDELKTKAKRLSFYCLPDPTVIDDLVDVMCNDMYPWLTEDLGFSFFEGTREGTARHAADSAIMFYRTPEGHPGADNEFFAALSKIAHDKGADVRTASPITGLVQDPLTKEILGCRYTDADGAEHTVRASHGVIMCTGGFENSRTKQAWYNHAGIFQQCWGTPYNTGDGIDICSAAGAAIWHLEGCEWSACAYRLPSEEVGCAVSMPEKGFDPYHFSYLWVNKYGKRFMNEETTMNHNNSHTPLTDWDSKKDEYPNLPFWMVFDQEFYDSVDLYQGTGYWGLLDTYCGVHGLQPTEGWNDYAQEKGWIVKADTLEELAAKMQGRNSADEVETCDADGLAATVKAWNTACDKGKDADFSRDSAKMKALSEDGPYYAIEMCCSSINTQGGPAHDGKNRSLDAAGNPIPRLYNCGEFGSVNGFAYVIGNICEALTADRIAALDAAGLSAWEQGGRTGVDREKETNGKLHRRPLQGHRARHRRARGRGGDLLRGRADRLLAHPQQGDQRHRAAGGAAAGPGDPGRGHL